MAYATIRYLYHCAIIQPQYVALVTVRCLYHIPSLIGNPIGGD